MSTGWLIVTLVALAIVVLVIVPYLVATAHRLDRLHVRTDAAWAGLDAALARRAVIARAAIAGGLDGELTDDRANALREAADAAESAPRLDREAAENELTRALAGVDRARLPKAIAAEFIEAEHRMMLARRVHNDAVRDTLALRGRRVVRWLKLAGTAAEPAYFEIAEPQGATPSENGARHRRSARVLLIDGEDRLLLFRGHEPRHPASPLWFTTGGGVEFGEQLRETAVREVREETGIVLKPDGLTGPVWRRQVRLTWDGVPLRSDEWFFLARVERNVVNTSGTTRQERSILEGHRWWKPTELATTTEAVYPEQLGELLPGLLADGWDGQVRQVR
ncbi:MAG: NUDIX hydrolase [Sciscionella sp.]